MKVYWPVALSCSVVGSFILAPLSTGNDFTYIPECILPALLTGALMAFAFREFFLKAPWALVLFLAVPMGLLHVALFGAVEAFIRDGTGRILIGFYYAIICAIKFYWLFIPLAVGANALLKFVGDRDVEEIDVLDIGT